VFSHCTLRVQEFLYHSDSLYDIVGKLPLARNLTLFTDLRDPSTTPLNFTKSINLALSERGINAMRRSESPKLLEQVFSETIPMKGRMIHGRGKTEELTEQSQEYDIHGRVRLKNYLPVDVY
jgi:hypothetical protein